MEIKKRIIAFLLVACSVFTLCACGEKNKDESGDTTVVEAQDANASKSKKPGGYKIEVKEIGKVSGDVSDAADKGAVYKVEDKYGIFSYTGKDTGAKYLYAKAEGDFFAVCTDKDGAGETTVAKENNLFNLVDAEGNVLISKKYATFEALNERYVVAIEVADITTSKDDAILFSTERNFAILYEEGDTLYSGNWVVYDVIKKTLVSGVGGTTRKTIQANGDILTYRDETNRSVSVNADGKKLPESVNVFDDGSYAISDGNITNVYKTDGTPLFKLELDKVSINGYDSGYYRMSKYVDGKSSYYFVDKSGKTVSAEYDKTPFILGKFIEAGEYLYDFEGNAINADPAKSISIEQYSQALWSIEYESGKVDFIDENGDVYCSITKDEANKVDVFSSGFSATKKVDDKTLYYNFKDKEFNFKGSVINGFVYKRLVNDKDYIYEAVNIMTGEQLFTSESMVYSSKAVDGTFFICARNADDTYSVYKMN